MQSAKILWGEGLFLRPQHFQQQDAYAESLSRHALMTAQPFAWGIKDLELDADALKSGTLRLLRVNAILADGTAFSAPGPDQLPPPIALDPLVTDQDSTVFYLAVHHLKTHGGNCAEQIADPGQARFLIEAHDASDLFTDAADAQITTLSQLAYLKAASEPLDQFATLPLLRVRRTTSDGFERDPAFIPPAVTLRAAPLLHLMLRRQIDALRAKVDALYGFHREPSQNVIEFRSGDIASFWLLHTASSACAALTHLFRNPDLHPERLFQELLRLAGGLLTFSKQHSLNDLPAYDHSAPGPCFTRLDMILRDLLDTVISTRYFSIALTQPKPAFYAGRLDSDKITEDTTFYLSISATQPQSELIESVPLRLKVGAPDDVEKLVLSAMSGVRLSHAAQVPAAIPVRPGALYFALDSRSPLYERMLKAQSIMIYAPESYQDLKLELIAVTP
ncbi:type VI secretion system baseplate subunit TssK [Denitromonas sp.]|uniref:type VI secretion system baseplate subunit TssK n=1 Tax=Denitromonas sp. TaxID=2734609 RepID=UPI003A8631BF